MNLNNKKIKRNSEVVFKIIDSKVLILDEKNEQLRELNETASIIWQFIDKPRTIDEIAIRVSEEFNTEKHNLLTDITNFVNLYYKGNLISIKEL